LSETLASLIDIAELIDGGRMPLRDQDLSRLAAEVAADWRSRCPGATVNLHAPSRPLLARVDGDRIRRVMNTLLANWMRRTGPRATVDLSLDASAGATVLRMTSVDGLPEALMNQSLDPDQLAHSGVEDPSVLPLYIAAVVARAHKGTLVVSEDADRRATVSLQLPSA
jgi:K+-sensing histidine kinase KdpD